MSDIFSFDIVRGGQHGEKGFENDSSVIMEFF